MSPLKGACIFLKIASEVYMIQQKSQEEIHYYLLGQIILVKASTSGMSLAKPMIFDLTSDLLTKEQR